MSNGTGIQLQFTSFNNDLSLIVVRDTGAKAGSIHDLGSDKEIGVGSIM